MGQMQGKFFTMTLKSNSISTSIDFAGKLSKTPNTVKLILFFLTKILAPSSNLFNAKFSGLLPLASQCLFGSCPLFSQQDVSVLSHYKASSNFTDDVGPLQTLHRLDKCTVPYLTYLKCKV